MSFDFSRMLTDEEAKKIYTRLLKKEENVIDVAKRLVISVDEVYGLSELLSYFGYPVEVTNENDDYVLRKLRKQNYSTYKKVKIPMEECNKTTIGFVSDTHLCSKEQQLHMLNTAYRYFYEHEISDVLHCGDVVDGDYGEKRKSKIRFSFILNNYFLSYSY